MFYFGTPSGHAKPRCFPTACSGRSKIPRIAVGWQRKLRKIVQLKKNTGKDITATEAFLRSSRDV